MPPRPSWEGYLRLNLLSIPIKAYSAAVSGRGRIGFNQIHANCGSRIRHVKVCPVHGEVAMNEIVRGFEYAKGQYVVVENNELKKLHDIDEKAISVDVFIPAGSLDAVYYSGRSYYLIPGGKVGEKPFAVLQQVMSKQKREAIAKIVFAGRQQMAAIRPVDNLLAMTLLNYDEQVQKPDRFAGEVPDLHNLSRQEVSLAESLVEATTVKKFDYSVYLDEFESKLTNLIEAKAKGNRITSPRKAEEPAVTNLMDALRKSLQHVQKQTRKPAAVGAHAPKRRKSA
jgi:DNA end-binding protein Ku